MNTSETSGLRGGGGTITLPPSRKHVLDDDVQCAEQFYHFQRYVSWQVYVIAASVLRRPPGLPTINVTLRNRHIVAVGATARTYVITTCTRRTS